jgi:catabolite regulation protein CreA
MVAIMGSVDRLHGLREDSSTASIYCIHDHQHLPPPIRAGHEIDVAATSGSSP